MSDNNNNNEKISQNILSNEHVNNEYEMLFKLK